MAKSATVFQLGIDLDRHDRPTSGQVVPSKAHAEAITLVSGGDDADANKDYWIEENGCRFAGRHLIVDLWGAERLDDLPHIEATLREAVDAANATLLHIHLHHFTPNGGVSGVAVLAESHISIHSWPEKGYAALDVFMCGDARPEQTIPVLKRAFRPAEVTIDTLRRGNGSTANPGATGPAGR